MDTYRHGEIGSMRISYRHKERERESKEDGTMDDQVEYWRV